MKESAPRDPRTMTLSELNGVDCEQDLVRCHPRDVDEYGDQRGRFGGPVCRPCRRAALHAHLCIILTECANKGPVHGLHSIWWSLDRNNFAYENYVDDSVGTAAEMAHLVVEEHWLWDHTRWRELIHPACALQKDERRLRRNYLRGLGVANETDHLHRLSLQADIRGEEMFSFEQDDEEMMCLCREWDTEDKEGVDLADESSDDGNDFEENTLEPRVGRCVWTLLIARFVASYTRASSMIGQTTEYISGSGSHHPTKSDSLFLVTQRSIRSSKHLRPNPLIHFPIEQTAILPSMPPMRSTHSSASSRKERTLPLSIPSSRPGDFSRNCK